MRRRSQPEPFRAIVADPPWSHDDQLPGDKRGAGKHYPLMTIGQIESFALPPIAEDAILFLWRMASMPQEALWVCRRWGFEPKSEIVWVKTLNSEKKRLAFGMGRYVRNTHETCLIGARGRGASMIRSHSVRSVFFAPIGAHSEKPEAFFPIVEELVGGPYLELFARCSRPGWTCEGGQLAGGIVTA